MLFLKKERRKEIIKSIESKSVVILTLLRPCDFFSKIGHRYNLWVLLKSFNQPEARGSCSGFMLKVASISILTVI